MKNKQTYRNTKFSKTKPPNVKQKSKLNHTEKSNDVDFLSEIDNSKKWYEEIPKTPTEFPDFTDQVLIELKDEAHKYHDAETGSYNARNLQRGSNSDYVWLKTVLSKGTSSDKIAAHVVMIQNNPIYNLSTLRNLINMVKVGKKKECIIIIETLSELFLSDLLPPEKKLRPFHQQPLSLLKELCSGNIVSRKSKLITWYFEDQLKEVYTNFIQALNTAAHDSVESNKEKAVSAMYTLLAGHPEQEKNLLTNLINKLGDPSQKVASKTIYCLGKLLYNHPNMKQIVLVEMEKLLFRPNVSHKAQYYGICFLSQFYLSKEDQEVAQNLITVYFSFFKACVKKGEIDSRMMAVLLMGVNRAFPFAKLNVSKIEEHVNTMYKVVHLASFNVSLHALNLLFQISGSNVSSRDRYYNALYKKLICFETGTTSQQPLLLSLVYRSLKKDSNICRIKVFIKRLLQVALNISVPMVCGILYMISELFRKSKHLMAHELVKTVHSDGNVEEKNNQHILKTPDNIETKDEKLNVSTGLITDNFNEINDWDVKTGEMKPVSRATSYNPYGRIPAFSGGEFCVYTELIVLQNHFHPTVSLFATNLVKGEFISYSGDPLRDFMPIRFLDRYVFKNPKKIEDIEKKSMGLHSLFGQRKQYIPEGVRAIPVNTKDYINVRASNVPVDERFLYEYLKLRSQRIKSDKDDNNSDLESVASDEFEEMLDKMTGKKNDASDDEDMDFLNEIGDSLKSTNKHKNNNESEDDDLSENDDNDNSKDDLDNIDEHLDENELSDTDADKHTNNIIDDDGDLEMGSEDEELLAGLSDDDFSDIEFTGSEGGDSDTEKVSKNSQNKNLKKKVTKYGKDDLNSVFASAEEFAMMLEEAGSSKIKMGGSNEMSNKDKADIKQIAWEEKRNRWISGYSKAVGDKRNQRSSSSKKVFKRKKQQGHGNKIKKMKKK